jgi:threonylcarbamoyladenosine tRNA methylthiotransferase MtaB
MPTVAFATLGCRLNQVDTQSVQGALETRGFRTAGSGEAADVVVINTCTVTARAEASDRQAIRRLARAHPGARVVVTGCWAQTDPQIVAALPGVDLVVGNGEKHRLPDVLQALLAGEVTERVQVGDVMQLRTIAAMPWARPAGRSRAFLKIQEGCAHRCAFCIVPRARGASRSMEPEAVVDHVDRLVEAGHLEVTLTGVDLGSYGADLTPRTSLAAVLAVVVEVPGLHWIRLSSLLPAYFTPELVDVLASSKIAPHFHIPLQSGSDRVLRRMHRPYTAAMYGRLVERLGRVRSGLGLGADVIVGHPGETERDFEETVAMVEAQPFSYLHVFPYSDRRGTAAAAMIDRVDARTAGQRSLRLRDLALRKNRVFREALVGSTQDVLSPWTPSDCRIVRTTIPGKCRAVRNSVWVLHGPSSPTPRLSWPMSPRATWTQRHPRKSSMCYSVSMTNLARRC